MKKKTDTELYLRILSYVRKYWPAFVLAIFCMIGTAATEPAFPAIMKYLLDEGFKTTDSRLVWLIPLGIVSLFLLRGVFSYCTGYLMAWLASKVVADLRQALFARLITLPSQHFDHHSAGQIISRLLYDVSQVSEILTTTLVTLARESLTSLALLIYLFYLDWKLTLVTLCIAPLIAYTVKIFSKRMRAASQQSMQAMRNIAHAIEETVAAQKMIKVFGGQQQQTRRFAKATDQFRRAQMREAIPASATTPITHIAASIAVAMIIYLALSQTTGQAGASAGGFIAFLTAMLLLIAPLKQLTTINNALQKGLAATESIFDFLDTPGESDQGRQKLTPARGDIEFQDINFSYPDTSRQALRNINFKIHAGQTVALVGASGGGKTTIGNLIPRFYHASSGRILLDGIDIEELDLLSLRRNIALVSQDVVLFNDSIAANIAFGAPEQCSIEDIIHAAKAAHAWEFIEQLPDQLNTLIGEKGGRLSGGQRQRIAIARALLKNAPILILDEATSALDTESERQVQAALNTLMKNRTTLVIAHRLSTIEHADRILVLHQGCVVEVGSHAELLGNSSYYANLIYSQN